jgi:hypothetical protein
MTPQLDERPARPGRRARRRPPARSAVRSAASRSAAPRPAAPRWLTPKRVAILGLGLVITVGGGAFVAYSAMENAAATPDPISLADVAKMFSDDPFAPDPEADLLKAQAAQALKAAELKAGRAGRKDPLDPVYVPKEAPGGDGFSPQSFPPGSTPDPGSNKALGKQMNAAMGWESEWGCLEKLWDKESHWNERAMNRYSGAYGIPQSLPGTKMASAGADWQTNPATQIKWGLGYIKGRYGSPCGAWNHSVAKGWY